MEILNIPTPSRTRLQAKLRLYKSEAEKLKRDLVILTILRRKTKKEGLMYTLRDEIPPLYLRILTVMNCLADSGQVTKTDNLISTLLPWISVNVY